MKTVRGMRDVSGIDLVQKELIKKKAMQYAMLNNFNAIQLPIIELEKTFIKLGDNSDIVAKELYRFQDRKKRDLCLRPEMTSGVVRNFISSGPRQKSYPYKIFSCGSLFRYDRPQEGRYREFEQINFEIFNNKNVKLDYQKAIDSVHLLMQDIGADKEIYEIQYNILPSGKEMQEWKERLISTFLNNQDKLSEISKSRIKSNPIRILDSKETADIEFLNQNADLILPKKTVNLNNCTFNPKIVRGLDYYTGFVFEVINKNTNNAVLAGGEYNNLVSQCSDGKHDYNAFGFAGGVERLSEISSSLPLVIDNSIEDKLLQKLIYNNILFLKSNKPIDEKNYIFLNSKGVSLRIEGKSVFLIESNGKNDDAVIKTILGYQ